MKDMQATASSNPYVVAAFHPPRTNTPGTRRKGPRYRPLIFIFLRCGGAALLSLPVHGARRPR